MLDFQDTLHSFMLVLKNACKGDAELERVQGCLLTNKDPKSVAAMLRDSQRIRDQFTKRQRNDVTNALRHLGFFARANE